MKSIDVKAQVASPTTMKGLILTCFSMMLLLGCASSSRSGNGTYYPRQSLITQDEHYEITGSTSADLHQQMLQRGPKSRGKSYYGELLWSVRWSFRYASKVGQCKMTHVEVPLTITMILPRWKPPVDTPAALIEQWNLFMEALTLHEKGHRKIAMDAGREIIRTLKSMRTLSCSSMQAEANRQARAIIEKYNEQNRQYDQDTRHGLSQGAAWPLRDGG